MRSIFASGETGASHGATVCDDRGDPDGTHPIYDSEGARLYPGRWNTVASPIIQTSEHYSTAMLEKLVHASSVMPPNQHYIRIVIPNGVTYEIFPTARFPDGTASARISARPLAQPGSKRRARRCRDFYLSHRIQCTFRRILPDPFRNFRLKTPHPSRLVTEVDRQLPHRFIDDSAEPRHDILVVPGPILVVSAA